MDAIKQWAFAVCAAMIAVGISRMILPKSSVEKVFKITASVFFLCCLLSPIVISSPNLKIELSEYPRQDIQGRVDALNQVVNEQTGQSIEKQLIKIIETKLQEKGIKYYAITINMNRKGQSEQPVEYVAIELDAAYEQEHKSMLAMLEDELGLSVRLGYATTAKGG